MENSALTQAWNAALAADNAWQDELTRQFGSNSGDARYTKIGEGTLGSELRLRYIAFRETRDHWMKLYTDAQEAGDSYPMQIWPA